MYSDDDLDSAVQAGVMPPATANAFRQFVARRHATHLVDEENFRLVSSFNDFFVVIACGLLLSALAGIFASIAPLLIGPVMAATAWALAEFFTRKRRMALPSIMLLLAFCGSVAFSAGYLVSAFTAGPMMAKSGPLVAGSAAVAAALAAWAHWQRFQVPITVAAGMVGLATLALQILLAMAPHSKDYLLLLALVLGVLTFALALYWDMSDRERKTHRSDVAFWLHLLAAPMIVHPIFTLLGINSDSELVGLSQALTVIALYIGLGVVGLVVDRRALLVSALIYVLWALNALFKQFGAVSLNVALTALVIGSALLLLSAFWHSARGLLVRQLPLELRTRLPAQEAA